MIELEETPRIIALMYSNDIFHLTFIIFQHANLCRDRVAIFLVFISLRLLSFSSVGFFFFWSDEGDSDLRKRPRRKLSSLVLGSRSSAPREEVVRFASFESASVPHERRVARANAHNFRAQHPFAGREALFASELRRQCLAPFLAARSRTRYVSHLVSGKRKVSARIILWNIYNVARVSARENRVPP